jgi:uncharacterized protein YcnI
MRLDALHPTADCTQAGKVAVAATLLVPAGCSVKPSSKIQLTDPEGFSPNQVQLSTPSDWKWCFHEGSHGHNPEYVDGHQLTHGGVTIWTIRTSGEAMVPKTVSPTGVTGHTHTARLTGDKLTVTVTEGRTGQQQTTMLSVRKLFQEFRARGDKPEFYARHL